MLDWEKHSGDSADYSRHGVWIQLSCSQDSVSGKTTIQNESLFSNNSRMLQNKRTDKVHVAAISAHGSNTV